MNDIRSAYQISIRPLPNPSTLVPQPSSYWERLRVWHSRVITERLNDVDYVQTQLSHLGLRFLQFLRDWTELSVRVNTISAISTALAERIVERSTESWSQDLFLLLEFVNNRSYDAIETIGRVLLPPEVVQFVDNATSTPNARRLAVAMNVYFQNPDDLALLMLFEMAERSGYTRYALVPQFDIPEQEAEDATQRIQQGFDLTALTAADVNQVLDAVDSKYGGRRYSICTHIFQEGSDSTLMFIYRILKEANIPEIDRTLFGDQVETIVLKFTEGFRILEENSTKQIGASIAGTMASHFLEASVAYVNDSTHTTDEAFIELLDVLQKGSDDRLHLVELYLHQSPIEGSPALILRCEKEQSLVRALEFLESRYLQLLDELDNVRHIGVSFSLDQDKKAMRYIFKLRFDRVGRSYFVRYSGSRISRRLGGQFELYLREAYRVKVIPATG